MARFVNSSSVNAEAQPGQQINAITEYNGSGHYEFLEKIGGTQWSGSETGGYSGPTAEEIVERTTNDSNNVTPLLNFQTVTISGYNGRGLGALPSNTPQAQMPGYDQVSGISNGTFTVTDRHCDGS